MMVFLFNCVLYFYLFFLILSPRYYSDKNIIFSNYFYHILKIFSCFIYTVVTQAHG